METKTKIIIGVASALTLGVGGYFIYRSIKNSEKEEEMYNSKKEGDIGYVEPKTTTTVTTPEQAGVPTVNPATTTPSIPNLATPPAIPNLGGFNLGSFGSSAATTAENKPTAADYIRMADKYMTWENTWKFASELGVTDKDLVGGTANSTSNSIISTKSREKFQEEIVDKFADWKKLFKAKAKDLGIPIHTETEYAKWNTDSYSFSGSQNNPANFWTSGR